MYIFVFHKPKQAMKNILFFIAWISLFVSFIAISTIVLWQFYPKSVSIIEKELHDPYKYKVRKLYKNTLKAKTKVEKFDSYIKLYIELSNITILNKYYHYRQEAATYLINHHLKEDQYQKAKIIVEKWKKQYPFDFTGKFLYAKVLESRSAEDALIYYAKLYSQYSNVTEVVSNYVQLLFRTENFALAKQIQLETESILKKQIEFKFYYKNNVSKYTEKATLIIDKSSYTLTDDKIVFDLEQNFNKWSSIRLKLQGIPFQYKVWNVKIAMIHKAEKRDLVIQSIEHMKKNADVYTVLNNNPYIDFNIPSAFLGINGKMKFIVSMNIGIEK